MTRKSDRFRPVRFCTVSPEAVCTWGGGGPPAAGGQSGSRRRAPGWLHWHAGDGDAGVQLPLARTSATSAGTSGTENQQTEGVLRGRGRAVGARRLGRRGAPPARAQAGRPRPGKGRVRAGASPVGAVLQTGGVQSSGLQQRLQQAGTLGVPGGILAVGAHGQGCACGPPGPRTTSTLSSAPT